MNRIPLPFCISWCFIFLSIAMAAYSIEQTLYEYYTSGGVTSGLSTNQSYFTLNSKNITIYSGALHYFRVLPEYWRDRLRKMRAAGLNCVETYIPWNLHEPEIGKFDFGSGGTEFEKLLNIKEFLKIAQEEDLLAIIRPGPYICAEWEYGGLPSWLLRDNNLKIRTSDKKFIKLVDKYFTILLSELFPLQFTRGGPIIAFQIENEYGNTKNNDPDYLNALKNILKENNIVELLFTSDTPSNGFSGTLPDVLATANFQENPVLELSLLKEYQPNTPLMVMEYWTGWFDHWSEKHHTRSVENFGQVLEEILNFNSSVNMYMFHGGTNWGLLNGANIKDSSIDNAGYQPDTTSYDYDAPLSESGDYTDKYYKVKEIIAKHNTIKTKTPTLPPLISRVAYNTLQITNYLAINDLIEKSDSTISSKPISMELLNINNNSGQSYGYLIYRKKNLSIPLNSILKIQGRVCDSVVVLVNGVLKSKILQKQDDLNEFGYWRLKDSTLNLGNASHENATLDLIVENWGRNNYGKLNQFNQQKGVWQGDVLINEEIVSDWEIILLEFKRNWTNSLIGWKKIEDQIPNSGPALYKASLNIDEVRDTYIDMRGWVKGIIIVNGFVLARYLRLGPQQTAYLPGPLLQKGENTIIIFEHFVPARTIEFAKDPIFETLS